MNGYKCVVVMAGHAREAEAWRRTEGLTGRDWIYAGSPRSIEGIRPTRVVRLPGFSRHRYAWEIERLIERTLVRQNNSIEIECL